MAKKNTTTRQTTSSCKRLKRDIQPTLRILMVQESPSEASFVEEALTMHDVPFQLIAFQDGAQVLDYLELLRITGMESCPDVLLLDLNLTTADSADVLTAFRRAAGNQHATLIVTSNSENRGHADATRWFRQPFGFMEYVELGRLARDLQASKAV